MHTNIKGYKFVVGRLYEDADGNQWECIALTPSQVGSGIGSRYDGHSAIFHCGRHGQGEIAVWWSSTPMIERFSQVEEVWDMEFKSKPKSRPKWTQIVKEYTRKMRRKTAVALDLSRR